MKKSEVMKELEAAGTAQNRKVYARHGVTGPAFGVSYAVQGKLKKRIGTDHALARELWATGNHDARVLAAMISDPEVATASELEKMGKELRDYVLADALSRVAAASAHASKVSKKWRRAGQEFLAAAGWNVVAHQAGQPDADESELAELVPEIERSIHKATNRARYAMNTALISIGSRGGMLMERAVAAAKSIGRVEVDHGETGCKTPDAASYIKKTVAHRKKKAGKKKAAPRKKAAKKVTKKATKKRAATAKKATKKKAARKPASSARKASKK